MSDRPPSRPAKRTRTIVIAVVTVLLIAGAVTAFYVGTNFGCSTHTDNAERKILKIELSDTITTAQRRAVRNVLEDSGAKITYTSRAAALARAKKMFKNTPGVIENLAGNPFPASYSVLIPTHDARDLKERLRGNPGVGGISDGPVKVTRHGACD